MSEQSTIYKKGYAGFNTWIKGLVKIDSCELYSEKWNIYWHEDEEWTYWMRRVDDPNTYLLISRVAKAMVRDLNDLPKNMLKYLKEMVIGLDMKVTLMGLDMKETLMGIDMK